MLFERSSEMEDAFNVLSRVDEKTVMPSELLYIAECMRQNLRAVTVPDIRQVYNFLDILVHSGFLEWEEGFCMAKDNMKSVRLSSEVLAIVEGYQGKGFNQKFENLVTDFKKTLPEREAYKKSLDGMIKQKTERLRKLQDSISQAERLKVGLDKFIEQLENACE